MRLDHLTARIRPRTSWEGLDLGFALGRRWFSALWGLWWLTALPVGLAAAFWLPGRPDLWVLVVWWFKPLYEAPLLFRLSRTLFGEKVGLRRLWRERRRVLPLGLLPSLLWRRLDPSRSFHLPLIQLEHLRGRERQQRKRVLRGRSSTASWLTIICMHLESILWISALLLAIVLVPDELPTLDASAVFIDTESASYWIGAVLYLLAISVMAPFYVAAGFALYLTRRAELEAWDLELVFRRARAEEQKKHHRESGTAITMTLLILILCTAPTVQAEVPTPDRQDVRVLISEILEHGDFGSKKQVQTWVFVGQPGEMNIAPDLPKWLADLFDLLAHGANLIATPAKWLIILLATIAGVLILRRILLGLRPVKLSRAASPDDDQAVQRIGTSSGEALPSDIAAAVSSLIEEEDFRGALALLYRASLSLLICRHGLEIPKSATELECLTLVANKRPERETEMLQRLTGTWQRLAYAHLQPEAYEVMELLRDWQRWQRGAGELQR